MPAHTWTLIDVARGKFESDFFSLTARDLPSAGGAWKVTRRILQGGLSDGVDLIEIDNGRMILSVLPTRGMGIWRATVGDQTLGWRSPIRGPVHPKFVPLHEPSGLGWLDGFDELVARCGLESNGAPDFNEQGQLTYPLHGRIANRPAHFVEVSIDDANQTITVRGIVEETRFHFQKLRLETSITTAFNSTAFTIDDRVENFGGTSAEMQMLYHINVGEPLLTPGSLLVAPTRKVVHRDNPDHDLSDWNIYGPPVAGQPENCFFLDLQADDAGQTQVLLKNDSGTAGTTVGFNVNQLPYFTVWKNEVASADGYVTGLEPATNYPHPRSHEKQQGRVVELTPGKTWAASVTVDWLTSASEVQAVEETIHNLSGTPNAN